MNPNGIHSFNEIKCFTVRAQDLLMAMGIDYSQLNLPYSHVRAYLGYHLGSFKLFFVPVQGASLCAKPVAQGGADIMLDTLGNPDTLQNVANNSLRVLDLNVPCPNVCPNNSILNSNSGSNSLKK